MTTWLVTAATVAAAVTAAAAVVVGCGTSDGRAGTTPPGDSGNEATLTVSAASSLTDLFDELAVDFEEEHPGVDVVLNLDSSSVLASQVIEGAPADVYASADVADMDRLVDAGLVAGEPAVFATNSLVIVTKPGNPDDIASLADLADATRSGSVVSLCAQQVPCGRYTDEVLEAAGASVQESGVSRGQNVRSTLTAVTEGDAVAAVVYATDARAAADAVETVEAPEAGVVEVQHPIAVLSTSAQPELAQQFVDFVAADPTAVRAFGFGEP